MANTPTFVNPIELHVAFWNVQNVFDPGVVARGPKTQLEFDKKLLALANVIGTMFNGKGPDILCLAEIQNELILKKLVSLLKLHYEILWSSSIDPNQTGLGFIVKKGVLKGITPLAEQRPVIAARPRCLIAKCVLPNDSSFILAVNHWKSRLRTNGISDFADREETARWLGDFLANNTDPCVIVIGDFNAEPCEDVFAEAKLRSVRTFDKTLWFGATTAYLYNTAWRFLTEPGLWENTVKKGFKEGRPKTTHDGSPNIIYDQLLVSGGALKGPPLRLIEGSVGYFCGGTERYTRKGALRPNRWCFANGLQKGVSDHFPLVASFEIT